MGWHRFVEEINAVGEMGVKFGMHTPLGPNRRCGNSLHTHLADGFYLEPDELSRLFEWAREYHLDPVPEIQSLAHVYYLLHAHRELAELPEADFPDAYCPSNPKSYELLFDVMQEYVDLTKCRSIHIGHDEWRAGGLCPVCREKDTGELFAEDVLKVTHWLAERGLGAWMWGDHLLLKHNAYGCDWDDGRVWHNYAATRSAAALLKEAKADITILNWSWSFGKEAADDVIADLGFKQIFGNLHGRAFPDWPARSGRPEVLGGEASSWTAWEDYELGLLNIPNAMYSANLLWSTHWPESDLASERAARELPRLRNRLRRTWEKPHLWSEAVQSARMHIVPVTTAANTSLPEEMQPALCGCASEYDNIPFALADRAVTVRRLHRPEQDFPTDSAPIPINGRFASLLFWQVASEPGDRPMHAGDGTNYPREAAELLGWYEIKYEDGLTRAAEVRYGENVRAWNEGYGLLYHARRSSHRQAGRRQRAGDVGIGMDQPAPAGRDRVGHPPWREGHAADIVSPTKPAPPDLCCSESPPSRPPTGETSAPAKPANGPAGPTTINWERSGASTGPRWITGQEVKPEDEMTEA